MSSWYDEGYRATVQAAAEAAGITEEQARQVYSYLEGIGLIDYDIEKEVFYDLVGGDEDEEDE